MFSLNLLPPERQRKFRLRDSLQRWQGALLVVVISALLMNGAALAAARWMEQRLETTQQELAAAHVRTDQSASGRLSQDIRELNQLVNQLTTALPSSRAWGQTMSELLNAMPADVSMTELELNQDGAMEISGVAKTRAAFLELEAILKAHPSLQNLQTESQANKPSDVPFQYFATYTQSNP